MSRLALFDLDNTLLTGDSEALWVEYLRSRGALDAAMAERNAELDQRYQAGQAEPQAYCAFYASIFAGHDPGHWAPSIEDFFFRVLSPRIPPSAHALVEQHRAAGDLLVLTTASSSVLAQPTAQALGFPHLIGTELEQHEDGRFTGRTNGVLNMRDGKVERLRAWLNERGLDSDTALARAIFYSDSINDLPLLLAVGEPVVVDPDALLAAQAQAQRWPVLRLQRPPISPLA